MPLRLSIPHEQAADGNRTPNVADHPQEDSTPLSPYPPPPIGVYHQPTGMEPQLASGSSDGPTSHPGETEYLQAPVHLENTEGVDSSTEANRSSLPRSQWLIYEQPAESNWIDIEKREIAGGFHNQLKSFAGYLTECKERYQRPDNPPEHMQLLKLYVDQGENVNTSIRELIKASDETIRAVHFHDDGTPTQEVWDVFVRNFLRDDSQLQTTQDLMRNMDQWVCYYEADCTFAPKPFVLLGKQLTAYGFRHDLLNCADTVHGHHSPETKPVRDFIRALGLVAEEVSRIREHEPLLEDGEVSRRWPTVRDMFNWFTEKAEEVYDKIRDLVTVCEAGMPAPYRLENGSVAYGAALSFMGALLGDGRLLQQLENLRRNMVHWLNLYDRDCTPMLTAMRDDKQRIIEDTRRRREEHAQREEHR